MPDVTISALRALARAAREGVDGAADELTRLFRDQPDEVAALLGLAPEVAVLLADAIDDRTRLEAVESAGRRNRERQRLAAWERAESVAARLAATARLEPSGQVRLGGDSLLGVVREAGYDTLVFDRSDPQLALGIDRILLHSVLRECRGVETTVEVGPDELVVSYAGAKSRGRIRLRLEPPLPRAEVLRVPLEITAEPHAAPPSPVDAAVLRLPPQRPYAEAAA